MGKSARKAVGFCVKRNKNHGVQLLKCFTQQNPVKGQNSFHSQGSFYFDVKMIKRGFSFSFRRGGGLPPAKNAKRSSVIHRAFARL